ncbi:MBL fold metallo-hydrolase [Paucisalibacillus sp. EB02]|uniref:MBL fold metallo-hydrolase n=1 Tax=Paucisalibacillus sp. EB02 TaxID=1347087 RepID=UPI0004B6E029|nr:MBL fold metallo-hydrolase [Paucisalibacillus sp. EB02]
MKVTHCLNLYQLTVLPRLFPVNCYIYEEEEQLTLIDAGLPSSYKGIVNLVKKLNKPLTNIVLTHGHGDHVGALDRLKLTFPNAIVSISIRDSRLLKGDTSLEANEPQTPIKGGVPKKLITKVDRLLGEGDRVGSLEVYATPGHTPGSISLLDTNQGGIIAGDAFQTKGRLAVCGQMVRRFPFPTFGTWNKEISIESARKILKLNPTILAVGHGRIIENPCESIQKAINEAEGSLSKLGKGA